jgi:flagellar hook-length control protein FliK
MGLAVVTNALPVQAANQATPASATNGNLSTQSVGGVPALAGMFSTLLAGQMGVENSGVAVTSKSQSEGEKTTKLDSLSADASTAQAVSAALPGAVVPVDQAVLAQQALLMTQPKMDQSVLDNQVPLSSRSTVQSTQAGTGSVTVSMNISQPKMVGASLNSNQDASTNQMPGADVTGAVMRQAVAGSAATFAGGGNSQSQAQSEKDLALSGVLPKHWGQGDTGSTQAVSDAAQAMQVAVPQLKVETPAQASTSGQNVISVPVSQPNWGDALGGKMVLMTNQQHQSASLQLNPPALGPLEVKLNMSDGQANLTFSTPHLPVKEAIEAAAPRLREMLGDSGINLGSVSVNVGNFSQPQQQPNAQANTNSGGQSGQGWSSGTFVHGEANTSTVTVVRQLGRDGLVDTFV